MGQGLFSVINNAASLYIVIFTSSNLMDWTAYTGLVIWAIGFGFECIGDH